MFDFPRLLPKSSPAWQVKLTCHHLSKTVSQRFSSMLLKKRKQMLRVSQSWDSLMFRLQKVNEHATP